jgi:nucleotide-binding universal stress UspA family protein/predicted phosphoribosyltransferase
MDPVRHILVAVDFHAASLRAVAYATRLARSMGAQLTVLHAFDVVSNAYPTDLPPAALPAELRRAAERNLAAMVLAISERHVPARSILRDGMPAKEIVDVARDVEADLIVVGTHGRRGLRRLVLGSVAEQVVRRSAVPVITIHDWHFESRAHATRLLLRKVEPLRGEFDVTVAITRGAVPIAIELARELRTPLDVLMVEPISADGETPIGAVCEDGSTRVDDAAVASAHSTADAIAKATEAARAVARERGHWLAAPEGLRRVTDERVLLVTDVLLTPAAALVAADALTRRGAKRVSLAVPICAGAFLLALPPTIDSTICVETTHFESPLARVYHDDADPSNLETAELLVRAGRRSAALANVVL